MDTRKCDCDAGLIHPDGKPVTFHKACGGTGYIPLDAEGNPNAEVLRHIMGRAERDAARRQAGPNPLGLLCCDLYTTSGGFDHADDCAGVDEATVRRLAMAEPIPPNLGRSRHPFDETTIRGIPPARLAGVGRYRPDDATILGLAALAGVPAEDMRAAFDFIANIATPGARWPGWEDADQVAIRAGELVEPLRVDQVPVNPPQVREIRGAGTTGPMVWLDEHGRTIFTITTDGRVQLGDVADVDEAAKQFWAAVAGLSPAVTLGALVHRMEKLAERFAALASAANNDLVKVRGPGGDRALAAEHGASADAYLRAAEMVREELAK